MQSPRLSKRNRMEFGRFPAHSSHSFCASPWRKWMNVIILIFVNFINYTDRYNLAGVLIDMQTYFKIKNDKAGLIQTVFVITYMISAPLFGYFGDRYNRKILLALGILTWNAANVGASFVSDFSTFLVCRAIFGIGQACYTTIAPSIIGDLFVGSDRSKLLAIFYSAIPVGNGLGYIVGTQMAKAYGGWRWSLRATPVSAVLIIFSILVILKEPKRGQVEGRTDELVTSWIEDLKYLFCNKSFVYSSLGFTAVAFTTGAVSWWAPKLNYLGFKIRDKNVSVFTEGSIFGAVSLASGFFGLCVGYTATFKIKDKFPQVDPLVCGIGLVLSGPLLIATTYASLYNKELCYVLLFFGQLFMNVNWALTMDICLCVVVPSRRSSAVGVQLLLGHGLGDAGSPYLTGLFSDLIFDYLARKDARNEFYALQYSYFIGCIVEIVGSVFFFVNAIYIVEDLEKVKMVPEQEER